MRVKEIFLSIQGESSLSGLPTVFVRFAGCPLSCSWCDTDFAGGEEMPVSAVVARVQSYAVEHVCVTGGEPLPRARGLIRELCDWGLTVSVETSGVASIQDVDRRARIILDVKCPGSGMADRNVWKNLRLLEPHDEVKFVVADRLDYEWALRKAREFRLRFPILSPADPALSPRCLAAWIVRDRAPVRMQVQLHKIVGVR